MTFTPSEQTAILESPLRDLPSLFPNHCLLAIKRERARLQNLRSLRKHRGKPQAREWTPCDAWMWDAQVGSAQLLIALERTGLRP